ncbi:MAG: hypothetical protein K0S58_2296 [Nitrospira sp.]|nr:hypothetical protein [Nitrospira sp.]
MPRKRAKIGSTTAAVANFATDQLPIETIPFDTAFDDMTVPKTSLHRCLLNSLGDLWSGQAAKPSYCRRWASKAFDVS